MLESAYGIFPYSHKDSSSILELERFPGHLCACDNWALSAVEGRICCTVLYGHLSSHNRFTMSTMITVHSVDMLSIQVEISHGLDC